MSAAVGAAVGAGDGCGLGVPWGLHCGLWWQWCPPPPPPPPPDGPGDGNGPGAGVGGATGAMAFALTSYPVSDGDGKSRTGSRRTAFVMKSCQIAAGIEPPNTSGYPSTSCIGISPFG